MKIYKAIFRLDYPISYKVVDSLGSYLDFITQKLQKKPFKNFNNSIDFVLHALSSQAELEDGSICRFNISIKAIDVLVEFARRGRWGFWCWKTCCFELKPNSLPPLKGLKLNKSLFFSFQPPQISRND